RQQDREGGERPGARGRAQVGPHDGRRADAAGEGRAEEGAREDPRGARFARGQGPAAVDLQGDWRRRRQAVMGKVLDHLEEWIITFLMGAATVVIFLAVLHRHGAGWRIPYVQDWLIRLDFGWAQELCIYMFVWMCKFGAAYGVRTGIHV